MMAKRPGLLSWQDYKVLRFQKQRDELYPADFRTLRFPKTANPVLAPAGKAQIGQTGDSASAEKAQIGDSAPAEKGQIGQAVVSAPAAQGQMGQIGDSALAAVNLDPLSSFLVSHPKLDVAFSAGILGAGNPATYRLHERVGWALGKIPSGDGLQCDPFWQEAGLLFNLREVGRGEAGSRPFQYLSACLDDACGPKFRVWTDFLRDFYQTPLVCWWAADLPAELESPFVAALKKLLAQSGNVQYDLSRARLSDFPRLWAPGLLVYVTSKPGQDLPPVENLPEQVFRVLLTLSTEPLPSEIPAQWHLAIRAESPASFTHSELPGLSRPWQGWIGADDPGALLSLLDLRAHAHHLEGILRQVNNPPQPSLDLSVVITTYHRAELLRQAVLSVAEQTLPRRQYEILVVNNDPADQETRRLVEGLRQELFREDPQRLRLVDAPLAGLSYARNAGLAEANGEVICFLDDDALAHNDWLEHIWQAFRAHPQAGVVGGHIYLRVPQPRPKVLKPGLERFWTQFITRQADYAEVDQWMDYPWGANWCARRQVLVEMGGFRGQYGRHKNDFSGGEEIIAASLAEQLGYKIAIEPAAKVDHQPDPSRFTYRYLRKTIISQIIINYRMKRDLYLPKSITILNNLRGTQRFLKNILNFFKLPAQERGAVGLEYFYLVQAWARLSVDQLSDLFWRFYYRRRRQC